MILQTRRESERMHMRRVRFYCVFDLWLLLNKVEAILHLHIRLSVSAFGGAVLMAHRCDPGARTLISATSFIATAYLGKQVEYLFGSRASRRFYFHIHSWVYVCELLPFLCVRGSGRGVGRRAPPARTYK
jgi:hypothetical protein